MRTVSTRTTRISQKWGTSSGLNPEENFEEPEDLSDIVGLDAEIPRGSARPSGSLLEPKAKPRTGIGLEVGKSAGGGLGIGVSVPIGGPISARGGINIGAGGAIKGAQVGLGIGAGPISASVDVGTDQDDEGRGGCYRYVTVSLGPFSHTYGKNVCEPKPTPTPMPPSTTPISENKNKGFSGENPMPTLNPKCHYIMVVLVLSPGEVHKNCLGYGSGDGSFGYSFESISRDGPFGAILTGVKYSDYWRSWEGIVEEIPTLGSVFSRQRGWVYVVKGDLLPISESPNGGNGVPLKGGITGFGGYVQTTLSGMGNANWSEKFQQLLKSYNNGRDDYTGYDFIPLEFCPGAKDYTPIFNESSPAPAPAPAPALFSPLPPNPSPKKVNDSCCKKTLLMLAMLHKHHGVTPISGMEQLKSAEVVAKGENFQNEKMTFPFEVPKRWLEPTAKKEDKILVKNVSELLFIIGSQSERLERVIGTKEFIKDSEGKLRQSEGNLGSWLTGKNPDFAYPDPNDFWLNTDDGIIKEKRLEVRSLTDAIRYVVEMGNRLERILPIAELKDSSIPKRWIYPGAKGQQRVGNLIHLLELMVRSDDKHRGYWPVKVKVKDADPAIKGDQPVELEFHSQADVFRELFQFLIDMEGDGDMSSNFALRSAFQTCQMHQLTVQNNAMLDAIVEYLDFKVNKTKTSVPMPFNPFAGMSPEISDNILTALGIVDGAVMNPKIDSNKEADIEALAPNILQNSLVVVDIIECDESKTLNEALLELLKHSSASSAAVSERVSESALDRVVEGAGLAQKLTSFLLRRDVASALGIGDLDKWINSAELGYTDSPESQGLRFPESNPNEPYGRPIAENPKIKEIDTKEPKAD